MVQRSKAAAARLLRSWVRILPGVRMFVCCECCVLSGRGLCDELITRPEESYRLWYVVVCDLETSWIRSPWPTGDCRAKWRRRRRRRRNKFELLHIMLPRCVYISGYNNNVIFNVWVSAAWVLRLCAELADWQYICHSCANNYVLIGRRAPSPLNGI